MAKALLEKEETPDADAFPTKKLTGHVFDQTQLD
jgi:hypothetical protein